MNGMEWQLELELERYNGRPLSLPACRRLLKYFLLMLMSFLCTGKLAKKDPARGALSNTTTDRNLPFAASLSMDATCNPPGPAPTTQ